MLGLPSANPNLFARVEAPDRPRSSFDRSNTHKTAFNAGWLIPIKVEEILPGDTFNMNVQLFARLSTLLFPVMDNAYIDWFTFFCPNRVLWSNWEKFNGAQDNPGDSIDYQVPFVQGLEATTFDALSLGDYMGLPTNVNFGVSGEQPINALPFRMYTRIWNDWFRDENLQNKEYCPTGDGPDGLSSYVVLRRGKKHDYFTSALPWPQKFDAIPLPLGTTAPVVGTGQNMGFEGGSGIDAWLQYTDNTGTNGLLQVTLASEANIGQPASGTAPTGDFKLGLTRDPAASNVVADLSNATAATLNQLREAVAVQHLLELDARGGTRYVEQMRVVWGTDIEDYRVQRPEYLGGGSERISVRQVEQTGETATTPQGTLAGYGMGEASGGVTYTAKEHGYIMVLVNVRTDITYQQGLHRMWSRSTRYDFAHPAFVHLGEQAVLNKEIYAIGNRPQDDAVFGYQERYAEYRYGVNMVTGPMRSNYATSLDAWHFATEFSSLPVLNNSFIVDNPPVDRALAVTGANEPQVLLDSLFRIRHARQLPINGTPGLMRL